jgi:hypothetical protein
MAFGVRGPFRYLQGPHCQRTHPTGRTLQIKPSGNKCLGAYALRDRTNDKVHSVEQMVRYGDLKGPLRTGRDGEDFATKTAVEAIPSALHFQSCFDVRRTLQLSEGSLLMYCNFATEEPSGNNALDIGYVLRGKCDIKI